MDDFKDKTGKVSEILKHFSNKDKLAIMCNISDKEKNVTDIIKCCSISQSQVSQFLWRMKLEWILDSRKHWKEVFYKIKDKKVLEIIYSLKKIFSN